MLSTIKSESLSVRHNSNMRTLWIAYGRSGNTDRIRAALFNLHRIDQGIQLNVVNADAFGIEVKLPILPSGMYHVRIQDDTKSITKRIAIQ